MPTESSSNPFGDISSMMTQFKIPGVDLTALAEARRKDIEALVDANKAAFESMQALGRKQTEMFTEAMQGLQQTAQNGGASAGIGDPTRQAELVRKGFEKALDDMKELAEITRQAQADAMAHITRRANEHVAEIRGLMQPKQG